MWFVGYKLQPLRLRACSLCELFAFAHDTKDGSKFIILLVGVPGSCVLVRALLVRVVRAGWCGYLHTLNLVSLLVRVSLVRVLVGVVTCMP